MRSIWSTWAAAVAVALTGARCAVAAPPPIAVPLTQQEEFGAPVTGLSAVLGQLKRSNYLLGDMFRLRPFLSRFGMTFALQETSEFLGNATGLLEKRANESQ